MWQTICFSPPVRGNHEPSKGESKFNVHEVHAVAVKLKFDSKTAF